MWILSEIAELTNQSERYIKQECKKNNIKIGLASTKYKIFDMVSDNDGDKLIKLIRGKNNGSI